jgi:hypothetical protein
MHHRNGGASRGSASHALSTTECGKETSEDAHDQRRITKPKAFMISFSQPNKYVHKTPNRSPNQKKRHSVQVHPHNQLSSSSAHRSTPVIGQDHSNSTPPAHTPKSPPGYSQASSHTYQDPYPFACKDWRPKSDTGHSTRKLRSRRR